MVSAVIIISLWMSFSLKDFPEPQQTLNSKMSLISHCLFFRKRGLVFPSGARGIWISSHGLLSVHPSAEELTESDLEEIKDWILGNRRLCIEAIKRIENCDKDSNLQLVPCDKNFYLSWISRNPEIMIKYLFLGTLTVVAIIFSPSLSYDVLSHL